MPYDRRGDALSDPSVRIRTADARDHELLASLGARTFREAFAADNTPEDMSAYLAQAFSPDRQAAELADPGTTFLIAEAEGDPVGYARLKLGPAPDCIQGRRPVEIARFYAVTPWIGRGVGAALMQACLERAGRFGCDVIWLDVWERNLRAIGFYRRWGFVEVGTQAFVLGHDVQNDLLMQRRLPSTSVDAPHDARRQAEEGARGTELRFAATVGPSPSRSLETPGRRARRGMNP
jgi:diamine N-acetyltransferase